MSDEATLVQARPATHVFCPECRAINLIATNKGVPVVRKRGWDGEHIICNVCRKTVAMVYAPTEEPSREGYVK